MIVRLLLVEDNPGDALLLQQSLETAYPGRYAIVHVATLAEALAALAGDAFHAVLLDLGLPDSQGMHSADAIRAAAPALPLVAMTGLDDEDLASEAIRRGAQDYLLKGQVDAPLVARSIRHAIERMRTEERLRLLSEQADKHARAAEAANAAKSLFLANMSHELRTPMTAILGMTDMALSEQLPPTVRGYLQTTKEAADLLLELLNEILDLSRIEAGRFELETVPFSLPQAVQQVVKTLSVGAREKGLELLCRLPADLPEQVVGDPLRLRQVLMNLIGNAIKFTSRGEVVVRVENCKSQIANRKLQIVGNPAKTQDPKPKTQDLESNAQSEICDLKFSISDTGIGIAPEDQERVFSPFTQADASTTRRYGGTGLGLDIAQRLVTLMGGRIWLESQPGKGSTFFFTLELPIDKPLTPSGLQETAGQKVVLPCGAAGQTAASAAGQACPRPESPARRLRVLVAEDTPANQKVVLHALANRGHTLEIAENGRQAVDLLCRQPFDVVLMDIQMPEMDGFQATAAIRELNDATKIHVPIIAMTAYALKGDRERCLAAGMDSYLSKPIQREELIETVERLACAGDGESQISNLKGNTPDPRPPTPKPSIPRPKTQDPRPETQDPRPQAPDAKTQSPRHKTPDPGPDSSPFNLDEALTRLGGEAGLFREMAGFFFSDGLKLLTEIRAAAEAGDAPALDKKAHRLKGTVLYLGADAAVEAVGRVEALGRSGDLTDAAQAVRAMETEVVRLAEALRPYTMSSVESG